MVLVPPPVDGIIGEDERMFHIYSYNMILPSLEDIGDTKNFAGAEEDGDGEGDAEAWEVQEGHSKKANANTQE